MVCSILGAIIETKHMISDLWRQTRVELVPNVMWFKGGKIISAKLNMSKKEPIKIFSS